MNTDERLKLVEERCDRLESCLLTAIGWIAQSAVGVLSVDEWERLVKIARGKK